MASPGSRLLSEILQQSSADLAPALRGVYAAALQASLDAGTASNTALAALLMNATSIRQSSSVGGNLMSLVNFVAGARDAIENPDRFDAEFAVAHDTTHDAAGGDFLYAMRFDAGETVNFARIANFNVGDIGDAIAFRNAPAGSGVIVLTSSPETRELFLAYGHEGGQNSLWTVLLQDLDPAVLNQVAEQTSTAAQLAALNAAWGNWLI